MMSKTLARFERTLARPLPDARAARPRARGSPAPRTSSRRARPRGSSRRRRRRRARPPRPRDGARDGARARPSARVVDERAGGAGVAEQGSPGGDARRRRAAAQATLCGWIDKSRDMGGISFADVRDHSGIAQIVASEEASEEVRETFGNLRPERVGAQGNASRAKELRE